MIELIVLLVGGIITLLIIRSERKAWNNGINPKNGKKWKYFASSSQGGNGYTDGDDNYIWISWGVDK
jgi:hypothetical protein